MFECLTYAGKFRYHWKIYGKVIMSNAPNFPLDELNKNLNELEEKLSIDSEGQSPSIATIQKIRALLPGSIKHNTQIVFSGDLLDVERQKRMSEKQANQLLIESLDSVKQEIASLKQDLEEEKSEGKTYTKIRSDGKPTSNR
jgi:hypothetical protein